MLRRELADRRSIHGLAGRVVRAPERRLVRRVVGLRARGRSRRPCPPVIYSIPPSSPLHYVTYVHVYDVTPQCGVRRLHAGLLRSVVTCRRRRRLRHRATTTRPRIGATVWYPPPVTYGYAAAADLDAVDGLGRSASASASRSAPRPPGSGCWGYCPRPTGAPIPYCGHYGGAVGPVRRRAGVGPAAAGPRPPATSTSRWGDDGGGHPHLGRLQRVDGECVGSQVGHSYNSVTGRVSAGQRASVQNVYTGNYAYGQRGATYNPSTGVSARGGSVDVWQSRTRASRTPSSGGRVTGPGGQSAAVAHVGRTTTTRAMTATCTRTPAAAGNNTTMAAGTMCRRRARISQAEQQARQAGDQRSAGHPGARGAGAAGSIAAAAVVAGAAPASVASGAGTGAAVSAAVGPGRWRLGQRRWRAKLGRRRLWTLPPLTRYPPPAAGQGA